MVSTTVKAARKKLGRLVREVNTDTVAVDIVGSHGTAVLLSRERYAALQEATFLLRSPELMDSLRRELERTRAEAADEDLPTEPAPPPRSRPRVKNKKKKRKKRQHRR